MQRIYKFFLISLALIVTAGSVYAQSNKWRDIHKVKKKETIFSICKDYGISQEQLFTANPEMRGPGYKLKKGTTIFIPFSNSPVTPVASTATKRQPAATTTAKVQESKSHGIRLGVVLPLNDKNLEGKHMVEYYRGVLMACDSLKKEGVSVDVSAWNTEDGDGIKAVLNDKRAANCDLIIGPYYASHVSTMASFADKHGIKLVLPFSINVPELYSNRNIFQICQNRNEEAEITAKHFLGTFGAYHPIIVDCGDPASTKGTFTSTLRRMLDSKGITYHLTSINSSDADFKNKFDTNKRNVVVLNTARLTDMNALFGKLSAIAITNPDIQITVMGYSEWQRQSDRQLSNFYRYDVYIATDFFTNLNAPATTNMMRKYRQNFRQDMQVSYPRYGILGFDHAYFFLKGFHRYGKNFDGAAGRFGYTAVQTPLKFEHIGNGGLQNRTFMFVHYRPDRRAELLAY